MTEFDSHAKQSYVFYDHSGGKQLGEVDSWPLHITLTPYFTAPGACERASLEKIQELAKCTPSIRARLGSFALFGARNDIPAREVADDDGEIRSLHDALVQNLGAIGCAFVDLDYAHSNFVPHMSHHDAQPPTADLLIDNVAVGLREYGKKLIVARFKLRD